MPNENNKPLVEDSDENLGCTENTDVEPQPDFEGDPDSRSRHSEASALDEAEAAYGEAEDTVSAEEVPQADEESQDEQENTQEPPTAEEIAAVEAEFGALEEYLEEEPGDREALLEGTNLTYTTTDNTNATSLLEESSETEESQESEEDDQEEEIELPPELVSDIAADVSEIQPQVPRTRRRVVKMARLPAKGRRPHMQPGHKWENGVAVIDKELVEQSRIDNQAIPKPQPKGRRSRRAGFEKPMNYTDGVGPRK